jgi:catalase
VASPDQALDAIDERFGEHPGHRALHAKGILCSGSFTAAPAAAALTRAAHMQGGPVRTTVRFSNGSGDPGSPDYLPDVRGLAVAFHLAGGSRTDISAQTVPRFPFSGVEPFVELVRHSGPGLRSGARLALLFARHSRAIAAVRQNVPALRPPASYAAPAYHALHAFLWRDADGGQRYVRYTWRPTVELPAPSRGEARARGRDYLRDELRERLAAGPVRFELEVVIAGPGDDPDDPSASWPEDRERVVVGALEVAKPSEDGDELVFDPTRVVDGIELSDDPVLRFRPRVYALSHERRTSGGKPGETSA